MSHYDDHCAWCNISIEEICLYEIAVYDSEDNIIGYEYICRHCLGSWHW